MLKTLFISSVLLIYCYLHSTGQSKADYVWIFGSDAELLEGSEGTVFTFNENGIEAIYKPLITSIGNNNASISDEKGHLLFYTNGCAVFDSTFNVMENGDGINLGDFHDSFCLFGNYPGPQNSIIIPAPGSSTKYLLFHKRWDRNEDFQIVISGIHLTSISFEDSNLGFVVEKNIMIDIDRSTTGSLVEVIRHANGTDWWFIDFTKGPEEHFYLAYLIEEDTITLQQEIEIENIESLNEWCSSTSQSCFSPDGTKLAKMCPLTGFDLWDFDRSTGLISNYRNLPIETDYSNCGVGISPNSRFAYLSCADSLWQMDLWEEDLNDGLE